MEFSTIFSFQWGSWTSIFSTKPRRIQGSGVEGGTHCELYRVCVSGFFLGVVYQNHPKSHGDREYRQKVFSIPFWMGISTWISSQKWNAKKYKYRNHHMWECSPNMMVTTNKSSYICMNYKTSHRFTSLEWLCWKSCFFFDLSPAMAAWWQLFSGEWTR